MSAGRRLRVLISTSTYPVHPDDGIPRFVHDLARSMTRHAEISVLAPDAPGAARHERMDGVDVHRFSYFRPRRQQRLALGQGMRDNLRSSWLAKIQVPTFLTAQALSTRRMIRERPVDVVNAHWLVPAGLGAAWACAAASGPWNISTISAASFILRSRGCS